MAGTKIGGIKAANRNKELYGDDFYRNIGAVGGKKTHEQGARPKGFAAMSPEKRREAGKRGGTISRKNRHGKN